MPPVPRAASAPVAPSRTTGPSVPSATAGTNAAPGRSAAWATRAGPSKDGFASGPAGTTLRLPATVTLGPAALDQATQTYGADGGARLQAWGDLLTSLAGKPELEQVQAVHEFVLRNVRYESDLEHNGKNDYWETPTEALGSGLGDCEDFALLQYASLRQLGIPVDRLQVGYVKRGAEAHMVLTWRDQSGAEPWVLDNLEWDMLRTPARQDLAPVFGFNEEQLFVTRTLGDTSSPSGSPARLSLFQDWLKRVGQGA